MSRRRHTLRIALASAAVAGAVLAPVSTAFAAPHTPAAAAAKTADRHEGKPVAIGGGMVAVLRNDAKAGGPEAWIRAVSPDWKPGDPYLTRVLDVLDREHTSAEVRGTKLLLDEARGHAPVLKVTRAGKTASYPLPLGEADPVMARGAWEGPQALPGGNKAVIYRYTEHDYAAQVVWGGEQIAWLTVLEPTVMTKDGKYLIKLDPRTGKVVAFKDKGGNGQGSPLPSGKCVAKKDQSIGAGAMAGLYNTPRGPEAWLYTMGDDGRPEYFGHLDRKHPSLPKDAGIIAKITNVGAAQPKFVFQTEGGAGSHPFTTLFPKLPKGCVVVNHVK
ncbi:hypothetical protein [Streptomyces huiliensis]|uniref:hypothetical protein n=1 Tax=Streptomyces huiliensis TaxID=2876027 RepID=UPI001CBFB00D|nr:hypothetical protein [Streptomyces huiliensis]MBZ4320548.1 hypothetical protein [Streptomyces huiliensis]